MMAFDKGEGVFFSHFFYNFYTNEIFKAFCEEFYANYMRRSDRKRLKLNPMIAITKKGRSQGYEQDHNWQ